MSAIISSHNKSILRKPSTNIRSCNCVNREQCPLENKCLHENLIYQATVTSDENQVVRKYVGLCSTPFKNRLAVHLQHMNHREHMNKCELSKYVWMLKDEEKMFDIKWEILCEVKGNFLGDACRLCTTEKLFIIEHPAKNILLNTNCIQKCRHKAKYMLSSIKENISVNRNLSNG